MTFYEPAEDSKLMVECIKKYHLTNSKTILDIGSGSGILTKTLAQEYPRSPVLGIDINKDALVYAAQNNYRKNVTYEQLHFEKITNTFDFIVCNPPYLPANKHDPEDIVNKALVGGEKGYEYVLELITHLKKILRPTGHFYLLISNLTQPAIVEDFLDRNLFVYKRLEKKYVGMMEELYVYDITHNPAKQSGVSHLTFLAKGKRGVVLKGLLDDKEVTIKVVRPDSDASLIIQKEANMTKKANNNGVGPKYITHKDNYIIREYINGERIETWIKQATQEEKKHVFIQMLHQCFKLDKAELDKTEMTNPYKHILITADIVPIQIDFERMHITPHPKNVTQFVQYMLKIWPTLITGDISQFRVQLQQYKNEISQKQFNRLLKFFSVDFNEDLI